MKLQSSTDQDASIEIALRHAAAALQSGHARDAERMAREVLSRHSRHPGASQLLGMALLAQDRAGDAVAPLRDVHRVRPNAAVETYLAIALRKTGHAEEALTLLQRAIERQPPLPQALYELGTLLFEQRRLREAEGVLERGLALAPHVVEFSLILGNIFIDRGHGARAEGAFARVLAAVPGHPDALRGLGAALMGRGDFARAAERLTDVLARVPDDAKAQLLLANCLIELGRADEAVALLRTLVCKAPQLLGEAVQAMAAAGRGRLWLKPGAAAEFLGLKNPSA